MVSSIGDNDVGDVIDGNVGSKAGDVGDNGGMTCGEEVSKGSLEYTGGMKVWECGVENLYGMEVSGWHGILNDHPVNDHLVHQLD